jgi:hypothetical protein
MTLEFVRQLFESLKTVIFNLKHFCLISLTIALGAPVNMILKKIC